jgi:hypothetical protein
VGADISDRMMVTGVQPVGAKGLGSVSGAVVDTKETARVVTPADADQDRPAAFVKGSTPQPVVFPRDGLPMDQRPVSQKLQEAADRYAQDGGNRPVARDRDGDQEGQSPDRW